MNIHLRIQTHDGGGYFFNMLCVGKWRCLWQRQGKEKEHSPSKLKQEEEKGYRAEYISNVAKKKRLDTVAKGRKSV